MSTKLQWKIFASIGRSIANPGDVKTVAFTAAPSPRIYLQLGLPLGHAYIPLNLSPTATYYQIVTNLLRDLGYAQISNKPPYTILLPGAGEVQFNLRARLYTPNIVVLTVSLVVEPDLSLDTDFQMLHDLRSFGPLNVVRRISELTLGVIDSGDHRRPTTGIQYRPVPCFHLTAECERRGMPTYIGAHSRSATALLLGVEEPEAMSEDLIASALNLSKEINKKSSDEQLLLNKQGLLYLTVRAERHSQRDRFIRMSNLLEIGSVYQRFLDKYGENRRLLEDFSDYVFGQIKGWIQHPEAVFATSYTNWLAWGIVSKEFRLAEKLSLVENMNPTIMENVESKQPALIASADRWWERPEFSRAFDHAPAAASQVLGRIGDVGLRQSILLDLREAERSLSAKNFKAAVVMSGAAVEAMLLALLEQETSINQNQLRQMGLQQYLQEVKSRRLVSDMGMIELLDNSLRSWRNFVHPGKALRTGVSLTEDHATIAVTAARSLAKSLK